MSRFTTVNLIAAIRTGAVLGLAVYCAFLTLAYLSTKLGTDSARDRLQQAFYSGELQKNGFAPNDLARGVNQFNDCLILQTTLLVRGVPIVDAISPRTIPDATPCETLRTIVLKSDAPTSLYEYDRYLFAARVPTLFAFEFISLSKIRKALSALLYFMYFLIIVGALCQARQVLKSSKASYDALVYPLGLFFIGVVMASLSGVHLFARNIGHVYSELVLACYFATLAIFGPPTSQRVAVIGAGAFGAATAAFELLTGPALLGLILIGYVNAIQCYATRLSPSEALPAPIAYLVALILVLLLQQLTAAIATGRNAFADAASHLALRLQLHHILRIELPAEWNIPSNLAVYSPTDVLRAVYDAIPLLTYGSRDSSIGLLAFTALVIPFSIASALRSRDGYRGTVLVILLLMSLVPAWYLAFSNHSVIHALFMVRLVSLTWIGALILATLMAAHHVESRQSRCN